MNKPRRKAASGGWRLHDDRPPTFRGWISTDEGEIGRREWRGRTEIVDVHALDGSPHPFGDYRVTSSNGSSYTVEIRSLGTHINSCGCRDHRTNRLGTCKHIEGVLHRLRGNRAAPPRRRKPKGQESSGRIEIFLDERDDRAVRMTVPEAIERADSAFVQEAGRHYRSLRRDSRKAFDALRVMARVHPDRLRCSRSLETWIDARKAPARRRRERDRFVADSRGGPPIVRVSQAAAPAVPGRGSAPSRVRRARAPCRRHGSGKDRPGHCRLRAAARAARGRAGPRGLTRVAQGRVGGADRQVLRPPLDHRVRRLPGAPRGLPAPHLLHAVQLRAGRGGREGSSRRAPARRRDPRRGPAHQELADQDRERREEAPEQVRLRADRHAAREPHRRNLLDRPVPRPRSPGTAVPLQPGVLRAGRRRAGPPASGIWTSSRGGSPR